MSHFPDLFPDKILLLPPRLFGDVSYYCLMAGASAAYIDSAMPYNRHEKGVHRFAIVDAPGLRHLTVPVSRPAGVDLPLKWSDIVVSDHGKWWLSMPNALATAYSRSPFYEYYIHRFSSLLSADSVGMSVTELCKLANAEVADILQLETNIISEISSIPSADFRRVDIDSAVPVVPYWQMRPGFTPHLSVLDLIFNMGPEAPLYLAEVCCKMRNL